MKIVWEAMGAPIYFATERFSRELPIHLIHGPSWIPNETGLGNHAMILQIPFFTRATL